MITIVKFLAVLSGQQKQYITENKFRKEDLVVVFFEINDNIKQAVEKQAAAKQRAFEFVKPV